MMKVVTSVGFFGDSLGERISLTYSEIDGDGRVISDNNRIDRVVVDDAALSHISGIMEYANSLVNSVNSEG